MGIYAPLSSIPVREEEGLKMIPFDSEEEMVRAVKEGDIAGGLSLPREVAMALAGGASTVKPQTTAEEIFRPVATAYLSAEMPPELRNGVTVLVEELAYLAAGRVFPVEFKEEVLGDDVPGSSVPPRDRLRPLLAAMIIIVETLGLANLIAEEIQTRTLTALITTPLRTGELMAAKGVTGTGLALVQVVFFMVVVRGFGEGPLIILVSLLLGCIMVTAAGFLIGSVAKDFLSVVAWGMPALVVLFLPAFGIFFPGMMSGWVKAIPSYFFIDTVHRVSIYGAGWKEVWLNLLFLTGWDAVLFCLGTVVLRRRCA
jgi:ABC-2 type transport system permease protein